jgi:hypothetical protein
MPRKKKKDNTLKYIGLGIWFIIKIPYYIVLLIILIIKAILFIGRKSNKAVKKRRSWKKRASILPVYADFKIIQGSKGNFKDWEDKILSSDSKIGVILGARGSGKTAFALKFLENIHSKTKKKCFAMGFQEEEMPSWIQTVPDISKIANDSFVLIDEGGILFSARKSMSNANKLLSDLILISRHKNLNILFISQNSSNLDVNILRQADFLVLKPSSLLQINFERKIIQKIYDSVNHNFEKFKNMPGLAYIYSDLFDGFITNPLPSFWTKSISKSFK